jgi:hypothetical protein
MIPTQKNTAKFAGRAVAEFDVETGRMPGAKIEIE